MITEFTTVDDLLDIAKKSLDEVFNGDIDEIVGEAMDSDPDYADWDAERKQRKKNTTKAKMEEEVFTVRDLFRGIEWRRIPIGKRIQLGSRFYNEVEISKKIKGIKATTKTSQNQQQYMKI